MITSHFLRIKVSADKNRESFSTEAAKPHGLFMRSADKLMYTMYDSQKIEYAVMSKSPFVGIFGIYRYRNSAIFAKINLLLHLFPKGGAKHKSLGFYRWVSLY